MLIAEGPQPGSTPLDFNVMEDRIKSETPESGCPKFEYDHWQGAYMNTSAHKKSYNQAFKDWPTHAYMEAGHQSVTPERTRDALARWYQSFVETPYSYVGRADKYPRYLLLRRFWRSFGDTTFWYSTQATRSQDAGDESRQTSSSRDPWH